MFARILPSIKILLIMFFIVASLSTNQDAARADQDLRQMWAPWRSQFDGTYYARANCGPAALGITMAKYGELWSTNGIRRDTMQYMQDWTQDQGTSWEALVEAAKLRGFEQYGLYNPDGSYRVWSMEDLMTEVNQEHPVIILVRLKYLPGHSASSAYVDHYIVFLGVDDDGNIIYHDPAGSPSMTMSRELFDFVYGNNAYGLNWSGMSLRWSGE